LINLNGLLFHFTAQLPQTPVVKIRRDNLINPSIIYILKVLFYPGSALRYFILLLLLLPFCSFAQHASFNKTYPERLQPLFVEYSQAIGQGAAIYNGPEYAGSDPSIAGHSFYQSKAFTYGSALYLGYQYDSLVVAYDIEDDQLVLAYPSKNDFFAIVPVKSRIDAFRIHGHTFIHIRDVSQMPGLNTAGYYDLIHDGNHRIIAQRKKRAVPYRQGDYLYRYEVNDTYYILQKGKYRTIRGRRGLLNIFKEHKRELRREIRRTGLDFKTETDVLLQQLGPYLDNLE